MKDAIALLLGDRYNVLIPILFDLALFNMSEHPSMHQMNPQNRFTNRAEDYEYFIYSPNRRETRSIYSGFDRLTPTVLR